MSANYLEVVGLVKSFAGEKVLAGVSLAIKRGETVVVYGRSGSGKSALLSLISGAMPPDAGDIRINGASVLEEDPNYRGIGMAFQNFALYPHMTALANIASPLEARGMDSGTIRTKVEKVAEMLKIKHVLSHLPAELSNGQKQRTSLARALVTEPAVLLLDDPLRNVDAKLRYETRMELPELFARFGAAVLYVTQDFREAMALGDRIAILHEGIFVQIGTPAEVYEAPLSADIGRLFGDPAMNLIPCSITTADSGLDVDIGGSVVRLPPGRVRTDLSYVAGVRPEHVLIVENSAASKDGLAAKMETISPLNIRELVFLRTDDNCEIIASRPVNKARIIREPVPVRLEFAPEHVILFEQESGRPVSFGSGDA